MAQSSVDPDTRIALSLKQMVLIVGSLFTISTGVVGYFVVRDIRTEHAFERIQSALEAEAKARAMESDALVRSVNEVRDAVKQLVVDTVSVRQSVAWLEVFQMSVDAWIARFRSDNPSAKVPDLKVPSLPR